VRAATARDFAQAVSRLLVDASLRRARPPRPELRARHPALQTLAKLVADKYAELLHAPVTSTHTHARPDMDYPGGMTR